MITFILLGLEAKNEIESFTSQFESYSDFNFVSLYNWNTENKTEYALLEDVLLLKMADYMTGKYFVTVLGTKNLDTVLPEIKAYCVEHSLPLVSKLIPQTTADSMAGKVHSVVADIDSHDYILSVEQLMEMRANLYRGKRNLLNRFNRFYADVTTVRLIDLQSPAEVAEIIALNTYWREMTPQPKEETQTEFDAIKRSIEAAKALDIKALGVYVGNKLVAYVIFNILPNDGIMLHFEKSDHEFIGVTEFLNSQLAVHIHGTYGTTWINFQQDLGIENLRRAKESYKPVSMLKKYTVTY